MKNYAQNVADAYGTINRGLLPELEDTIRTPLLAPQPKRRLACGRLRGRTTRMVVPHARLAELASSAAQWRRAGYEVEISASPATLNRQNGESQDSGMRVIVRPASPPPHIPFKRGTLA